MIGKLLRILTLNYLTLGWWFPPFIPGWKKERRKMKREIWHGRVLIRLKSLNSLKDAMKTLRQEFPFLSPAEIKWIEKRFKNHSKGRVYIYADTQHWEDYQPSNLHDYFYVEHTLYFCCGTQWQDGDCGCLPPSLANIKLPVHPQPNGSEVKKKPKVPK